MALCVGVQVVGLWMTLRSAGVIDVLELAGIKQAMGRPVQPRFTVIGPYRLVRHPIYLGWILLTFGSPTMTATTLAFAVISTAYLAMAIPFEERSLVDMFGDEYRAYQRRVRWRMVPGMY
jgi:protein-S-isoprenylcysteine O-methyltransferase Ste14